MAVYIIKRFLQTVLIMLIVSLITFFALKVLPGDPAVLILGTDATPDSLALLRESMGLDEPLTLQYLNWIGDALRFDLGESRYFGGDVTTLIGQRLPVTISLAILSVGISFILALIFGTIAAVYRQTWVDNLIRLLTQVFSSVPSFWLGMLGLTYLAARNGWFPVTGNFSASAGLLVNIRAILLPALIMAVGEVGILIRQVRSSMINALRSEYMTSTEVKGLKRPSAIIKYAMRSAIMTPVTLASLRFAALFGGTAVIETVFSLAGLGRLLVVSVEQRDMMLLQGIVLFITAVVVMISFVTDILYTQINKTIRIGG